jgi:hypothetical protein
MILNHLCKQQFLSRIWESLEMYFDLELEQFFATAPGGNPIKEI